MNVRRPSGHPLPRVSCCRPWVLQGKQSSPAKLRRPQADEIPPEAGAILPCPSRRCERSSPVKQSPPGGGDCFVLAVLATTDWGPLAAMTCRRPILIDRPHQRCGATICPCMAFSKASLLAPEVRSRTEFSAYSLKKYRCVPDGGRERCNPCASSNWRPPDSQAAASPRLPDTDLVSPLVEGWGCCK